MRIAYFTEAFLPKIDGVVVTLTNLLDFLEQRGHECLLFAPSGTVSSYGRTKIIHRLSFSPPFYPEARVALPTARVKKDLQNFDPDIIHVLSPTFLGVAGMRAGRKLGIPIVASYNTDLPGFARRWKMGFLSEPIFGYYRWVHNQASLNLTPSEFTLHQLEAKGFKRLAIWTGGVDVSRFHPSKSSSAMRELLSNGETGKPLVVFVSRLAKEKRCDWLLPLVQLNPEIRLAIVGDGPDRQRLEKLFANTPTLFTGYLQGEELAAAYASSDIFAFTGAEETFGNVVAEAMASGLPVVGPRSGGVVDLVEEGVNGLLYDPENRREFLMCVRQLIQDPSKAESMGKEGRKKAGKYSWDLISRQLLEVYGEVIQSRHSSAMVEKPKVPHW